MPVPISVVMSVFDEQEAYLRNSIESILAQTFRDFEFLIINDASTNSLVQTILHEYAQKDSRMRLFENTTNQGLTYSLNKLLGLARGTYIARIDSDDSAHPDRLKSQWEFMESHPDYALCGSWSLLIDETGTITGEKKSPTEYREIKKKLPFYNFFTHSTFFFRHDRAMALGGYTDDLKKAQDYDFLLKISAKYPVAILPEFLCLLRMHQKSISGRSKKKQEWYALRARWNAVSQYRYPKTDIFKCIPAFFYFLFVPLFLEKKILALLHKKT